MKKKLCYKLKSSFMGTNLPNNNISTLIACLAKRNNHLPVSIYRQKNIKKKMLFTSLQLSNFHVQKFTISKTSDSIKTGNHPMSIAHKRPSRTALASAISIETIPSKTNVALTLHPHLL